MNLIRIGEVSWLLIFLTEKVNNNCSLLGNMDQKKFLHALMLVHTYTSKFRFPFIYPWILKAELTKDNDEIIMTSFN